MVACSACTFENAGGAVLCEMCGTALLASSVTRKRKAVELSILQTFLTKTSTDIVYEEVIREGVNASELRRVSNEVQTKLKHVAALLESRAAALEAQPHLETHVIAWNASPKHSTVRLWLGGLDSRSPAFVANGTRLQALRMDGEFIVVKHAGEDHWLTKANSKWEAEALDATGDVHKALVSYEGEGINRGNLPEGFKAMERALLFRIVSQVRDPSSSSAQAWRRGEEWEHCGYARRSGVITQVLIGSNRVLAEISIAYVIDEGDCAGSQFVFRVLGDASAPLLCSEHGIASESELAAFASKSGLFVGAFGKAEKTCLHVLMLDMVWSCYQATTRAPVLVLEQKENLAESLRDTLGDIMDDVIHVLARGAMT
eukprot:TRINITY_DN69390_c0_g1_i1.p1 TRINITY_DN69390_c0_g1~~TRINITY_DN69390_c0_g1_i1.p1  ORF type:complete len:392 (+),score=51.09 TRINITY_DN69390_c0_g1_i1:62-1177(+)